MQSEYNSREHGLAWAPEGLRDLGSGLSGLKAEGLPIPRYQVGRHHPPSLEVLVLRLLADEPSR